MLEYLFSNKNVEKILMYLLLHDKCNPTELKTSFGSALNPIQKTLQKLENGGLLVSFLEGRTRVYCWNPRYPFLTEIQALAKRAYDFLPTEYKEKYYRPKARKRPRKADKPQWAEEEGCKAKSQTFLAKLQS